MNNSENLKFLYTKKEYLLFFCIIFSIFLFNIFFEYQNFKTLKDEELYEVNAKIVNIYPKEKIDTLKLKSKEFEFFTSVNKYKFDKNENIRVLIVTQKITFIDFLKGFYAPVINEYKINAEDTDNDKVKNHISSQHENIYAKELYQALYFAIPISKELREVCAKYGVSHLIALSGFHLGVISLLVYFIFGLLYKYPHEKIFPYRNKKVDLGIFSILVLLFYLIYIDVVPSFLRAFVMFVLGFYFLRRNIRLFSFETLLMTLLIIIALFPRYLFSISLWFSIFGVFYIFLFIHHFKTFSKYQQIALFNIWIYLAMLPLSHYIFGITSYVELFSPIITLLFTIFYPLSLFLHILGMGDIFDNLINWWVNLEVISWIKNTNILFFIFYILVSLLSIFSRVSFYLLNISMIIFFAYLYI